MFRFRFRTFALAVLALGLAGTAWAQQGAKSNAELEAELAALKNEVASLRAILGQMLDIERMRVDLLSRSLESPGPRRAPDTSRKPPSLPSEPVATETEPEPPRPNKPSKPSEPGGLGIVSGKVQVPAGTPVAYVFVENVAGRPVEGKKVTIRQYNKQFQPDWAVVRRGTTIEFPNQDSIYHNVFSLSPGNTFDLGLYRKGDDSKTHRFLTPGIVDIYCNIHPSMVASVLVVPNHLFTKVREDGSYTLSGVPEGRRKVVAWAPGTELGVEWLEIGSGQEANASFTLANRSSSHKNKLGLPYGSYP